MISSIRYVDQFEVILNVHGRLLEKEEEKKPSDLLQTINQS